MTSSATLAPKSTPTTPRGRPPLLTLVTVEARLMLRDPVAVGLPLLLPLALLLILGSAIPDFKRPLPDLGGARLIDAYYPAMMVLLSIAIIATSVLPSVFATYRETGVLRRMSTTPVGPARMVAAQLIVSLVSGLVSILLMVFGAHLVLGSQLPARPLEFAGIVLLGTAAMYAIGLLLGALAPSGRAAPGIGSVVMFPLLFLGGVWVPQHNMPDALATVSRFSPTGPLGESLHQTWSGTGSVSLEAVLVLTAWLVIAAGLAIRFFRWE
jgi:ABC-type multidrug transport system, permease component